ncbi:hypothetical protein ACIP2X_30045 [Streptomyces sp. NPDC089424]|uniref:hypothetical protein n=1 Tax=Streptomyces sp. NPDC089424 TaxID=3365917 RepID=UPI003817E80F
MVDVSAGDGAASGAGGDGVAVFRFPAGEAVASVSCAGAGAVVPDGVVPGSASEDADVLGASSAGAAGVDGKSASPTRATAASPFSPGGWCWGDMRYSSSVAELTVVGAGPAAVAAAGRSGASARYEVFPYTST